MKMRDLTKDALDQAIGSGRGEDAGAAHSARQIRGPNPRAGNRRGCDLWDQMQFKK